MDGIEGSVESSISCLSAIAHVVPEIGTCIINDAGKQGAHMFSRYILTFNAKTKLNFFFNKLTGTITLNISEDMQM